MEGISQSIVQTKHDFEKDNDSKLELLLAYLGHSDFIAEKLMFLNQ